MSQPASSRSRILASVRRSLSGARRLPAAPQVTLPGSETPDWPLAERFAEELTQLGGKFVSLPAGEITAWLLQFLAERETRQILSWQAAELAIPGVLETLRRGGIGIQDGELPHAEPERSRALTELQAVTVGLTGADAALADTGSLALWSGPGRPRLASLSVRTHVALLDPRRLFASWSAWWAADGAGAVQRVQKGSNLSMVTGPSRTADIEMTLTVGVHGPGEVIVVLVN